MGFMSDNFSKDGAALNQVDAVLQQDRPFDLKTDELLRFALSINPGICVTLHLLGEVKWNAGSPPSS